MTFVVHSCFKKIIRKEIKPGSFKARRVCVGGGGGGGPSRDEDGQEVGKGDVCQSGLAGLERLVFQNCHGKH